MTFHFCVKCYFVYLGAGGGGVDFGRLSLCLYQNHSPTPARTTTMSRGRTSSMGRRLTGRNDKRSESENLHITGKYIRASRERNCLTAGADRSTVHAASKTLLFTQRRSPASIAMTVMVVVAQLVEGQKMKHNFLLCCFGFKWGNLCFRNKKPFIALIVGYLVKLTPCPLHLLLHSSALRKEALRHSPLKQICWEENRCQGRVLSIKNVSFTWSKKKRCSVIRSTHLCLTESTPHLVPVITRPGSRVSPCVSSSPCPALYTCVPTHWILWVPWLTVVSIRTALFSVGLEADVKHWIFPHLACLKDD